MTAPAVREDGSATPDSGAPSFTPPFSFDLEVRTMPAAPTSPYPREANVVQLRTGTENADTEAFELPDAEQSNTRTAGADTRRSAPEPPSAPPTPIPSKPTMMGAAPEPPRPPRHPEPPKTIIVPEVPKISYAVVWISERFSMIFAASVLVGLIGQITGFAVIFNADVQTFSGIVGILGALGMGGLFELTMVTSSMTAFRKISEDLPWWEISFYLAISFASLGVAAYMAFTHWSEINANMALPFGGLTIVGFVCHFVAHIFPALRIRKARRERAEALRRQREEEQRRAEEAREAWERWQREQAEAAEAERKRREAEAATAERNAKLAAKYQELTDQAEKFLQGRKKTVNKQTAVAIAVAHKLTTKAKLRNFLRTNGLKFTVSEATLKDWAQEAKRILEAASA